MSHSLEAAFTHLIDQNQRIIYKICYMYTNNPDDLADYYQETLINLWKAFPNFQNQAQESTWVYRISLNTCITFLRKKGNRPPTIPLTTQGEKIKNEPEEEQIKQL